MEQHHRQQAVHLGLVGHQLGERPAEPDRLGREVAAAAVALVEDQVDDREHRGEPVGQQVVGRHPERDPGRPILRFARTSRWAIVGSGTRNARAISGGGQAAERPQGERHLGLGAERRVAAGEDQLEPLVRERRVVHRSVLRRLGHLEQPRLRGQGALAADPVDRPVARRRDEPGARVRRDPVPRPALRGDRERLLRGFLGEVEVAEEADQRGQDTAPLVAEDLLENRYRSTIGRTSMAPPRRAAGIRAASSIAASRSSASKKR